MLRNHVFFRVRFLENKIQFSIQWEDMIRLDKQENSSWLLCGGVREDQFKSFFHFYVVPHKVVRAALPDVPWMCKPHDEPMDFRKAEQDVTVLTSSDMLSMCGTKLSIKDYRSRADLFEAWIDPYWGLLAESYESDLKKQLCRRCFHEELPDYGTDKHDYQCQHRECRLFWCGDYWNGTSKRVLTTIENRRAIGQPHSRGWWVFNRGTSGWDHFGDGDYRGPKLPIK